MSAEFKRFVGFFHQDAFLGKRGLDDVVSLALASMGKPEIARLREYLVQLSRRSSSEIIDTWNAACVDFHVSGANGGALVKAILDNFDRDG